MAPAEKGPPKGSKKEVIKKICLVGDSGTGKKTLVERVAPFRYGFEKYTEIIGTAVTKYSLEFAFQERNLRLFVLLWDVTGREDFAAMHPSYYKGAEGAIVVGSAANDASIEAIPAWIGRIRTVNAEAPVVVVITKTDMLDEAKRGALRARVEETLKPLGEDFPVFLTSAQEPDIGKLKAPFYELAKVIATRQFRKDAEEERERRMAEEERRRENELARGKKRA